MAILTPAAVALIMEHEVGGGEAYYNAKLKHPTWPGESSGVTIGVGYDLGYNTKAELDSDWGTLLDAKDIARLVPCCGVKRLAAKAMLPGVKSITVPWSAARLVFFSRTVPRFYELTKEAFPGVERLHRDAQGALISLVFNRGSGMSDGKGKPGNRQEMRDIRALVPKGDLAGIAAQIRAMKRLWNPKSGLIRRREDEAKLVESAIGKNAMSSIFEGINEDGKERGFTGGDSADITTPRNVA